MGEIRHRHLERLEPHFVLVAASETIGEIRSRLSDRVRWVVVEHPGELTTWSLAEAYLVRDRLDDAEATPIGLLPQLLTPAVTLERTGQGIGEARWRAWRLRDRVLVVVDGGRFAGLVGDPEHSLTRGDTAPASEARFLRAKVEAGAELELRTESFAPDSHHRLTISIGPHQAGLLVAEAPVPPEAITESQMLKVTIVAPWTTTEGQMYVPETGASSECVLDLGVPLPGLQRVMIMVMSETGLVQTATLIGETTDGEPEAPLALLIDASIWPVLGDAMPTIVSDPEKVVAAVPTDEGFDVSGVADMEQASKELHEDLEVDLQGLWLDRLGLDDEETVEVLRKTARAGAGLREDLFERLPPAVRSRFEGSGPVQLVVRDPKVDVAMELFYDAPVPSPTATLCPTAREALAAGLCPHCDATASSDYVCPMGFWGLRRVIERRVLDPDLSGAQPLRLGTGSGTQRFLRPLEAALVARSARVQEEQVVELLTAVAECDIRLALADNWTEWSEVVTGDNPPSLLIAMPHVDQAGRQPRMEIGDDELERLDISAQYVCYPPGEPGPLVLLLGCETASAPVAHRTMTSKFLAQGASIVLGTRMPVVADVAPHVGAALIRSVIQQGEVSFGEAVRAARCHLVGEGQLVALALVALGDGGWRIPARGAA